MNWASTQPREVTNWNRDVMFCEDYKSKVSKLQATDWIQPTNVFGLAHTAFLKIGDFPLKKKKSGFPSSVSQKSWQASSLPTGKPQTELSWTASSGMAFFFNSPHFPSVPPPASPPPHTQHGSLSKSNEKLCVNAAFKPFLEPEY